MGIQFVAGVVAKGLEVLRQAGKTLADVSGGIRDAAKDAWANITNAASNLWNGTVNLWSNSTNAIMEIGRGLMSNGTMRYFGEEIDKTSNWLAKIGLAAAGGTVLMPVSAVGDASFGANWGSGFECAMHAMNEIVFNAANILVSQEAYKALEDSLGEEWYGDFLRSSVNSVIGVGFESLKTAVHLELGRENVGVLQKIDGTKEIVDIETGELVGKNKKGNGEEITEIGEYKLDENTGDYKLVNGTVTQKEGSLTKTYIVKNEEVIRVSIYDEFKKRYLVGIEGVNGRAIDRGNYDEYLFDDDGLSVWGSKIRNGKVTDKDKEKWQVGSPEARYKKDFKESYEDKIGTDTYLLIRCEKVRIAITVLIENLRNHIIVDV